MKYILTAGWEDGVAALTERLARELAGGRRVLWLTSGGSNIPASVQVIDNISPALRQNLSIMLADERYGGPGHAQSNWAQLMKAGFDAKRAELLPVLKTGLNFEQTVAHYQQLAKKAFDNNDVVIAQLGIGDNGHIAGILPNSPAVEETPALAVGYQSTPFLRLTLSFTALRRVNAAYTFAFGNTKHRALTSLEAEQLPLNRQPAQILKQLPEAYLYSDQIGDHS
jgi:6-phosphogluconolactonase/glucosamine-6-phosphate isomerase/deaminase